MRVGSDYCPGLIITSMSPHPLLACRAIWARNQLMPSAGALHRQARDTLHTVKDG